MNTVKNVSGNFKEMYIYKDGQKEEILRNVRYDGSATYGYAAGYLNGKLEVRSSDRCETAEHEFCRDEENKVWVRREKDWKDPHFASDDYLISMLGLRGITDTSLYAAYGEFTYDKKRSAYVGTFANEDSDFSWNGTVKFTDGKVAGIRLIKEQADEDHEEGYELVFYDYGKTTVTLPTEWEERSEEWWEEIEDL